MMWRYALVAGAALAAAASSSGSQQRGYGGNAASYQYSPPRSQPMPPEAAVGLYRTSFGPVKIEPDGDGRVMGVWVYDRNGQEVIGFFHGALDGNVLRFDWQEPGDPQPLAGSGFLVFHTDGTGFWGKWWTGSRDRGGDWTGQRFQAGEPGNGFAEEYGGASYGGAGYGGFAPEPPPDYYGE